jgi:Peptidase family M23
LTGSGKIKINKNKRSFLMPLQRFGANKIFLVTGLLYLFFSLPLSAQDSLPKNYFRNPLDIPITLAGTFGEIRTDHYHTGLDIRTQGRDGLPVHAAAKGYVSRILVSPWGYGNALYITHPNGYITLYGHLSHFDSAIAAYVKNKQYAEEKCDQNITLPPGKFDVNQGDVIALSGSTGAALGPHLHFEIRNAKNDDPINPMLAGFKTPDIIPPVIKDIALYPLNDSSNINGKHEPLYLGAEKSGNNYILYPGIISAYGSIGVGINCYDIPDSFGNHNGPYSKILKDNGDTIYYSLMNVLDFSTVHYVNGHVDYAAMHKNEDIIEYSFLQENDKLNIYKKLVKRGRINCKPGMKHDLEYIISDFNGNTSTLEFNVQGEDKPTTTFHDTIKYIADVNWEKPFTYTGKGFKIQIPAGALFNNMHFRYTVDTTGSKTAISPVYNIQDINTPLSTNYTLMLKPKPGLPDSLIKKMVVVRAEGKYKISVGGHWDSGYMTVHPKTFGSYSLMLDRVPPVITPVNIFKNKDMSHDTVIAFTVTDNLSGIDYFRGTVDGKWILFQYNPKNNWVYYIFDEHVTKGTHHLRLAASDEVGNTSVYQADFAR